MKICNFEFYESNPPPFVFSKLLKNIFSRVSILVIWQVLHIFWLIPKLIKAFLSLLPFSSNEYGSSRHREYELKLIMNKTRRKRGFTKHQSPVYQL